MRAPGPKAAVQVTPRLFSEMVGALKAGKSQRQIAASAGLSVGTVQRWLAPVVEIMREHGEMSLAVARGAWHPARLTPEQIEEIGQRLPTASSLREISRDMGLALHTVQRRAQPHIDAMREAGTLGNCECGQPRFHPRICSKNANTEPPEPTPEQIERRASIVAAIMRGDPFSQIGERVGITGRTAASYVRWLTPEQRERRKAMEQARYVRSVGTEALRPHRDPLYAAIAAAVPRWPSEATRDDAISDLYLAVLEGSVAANDVAAEARRYATKAVSQWESRFGPRSLDELAFEGGRETLGDMIADPDTLEPLEWRLSA